MTLAKNTCNYLDVTRFIGIFLVVFGHIPLIYNYNFINYMIYSFHMPLFIIISGMLHKDTKASKKNVLNLIYSLLLPLLIYNIIAYLCESFMAKSLFFDEKRFIYFITGRNFPSMATWFLLVLFWIKLIALFVRKQKTYLIISIISLSLISLDKYFNWDIPNYWLWKSTCMSLPFFWFGILFIKYIDKVPNWFKILVVVISFPLSYLTVTYLTSISIAEVFYYSLFVNVPLALLCSATIIFCSQYVIKYVSCSLIKDISRGTMMILGLHTVIFFTLLPQYFFKPQPLRIALVLGIATIIFFYPLIKLTYKTIPVLYGKRKK